MKEWIKRSLRTFFQTAISYIAVNISSFSNGCNITSCAFKGLTISAIAAGLAAIMNLELKKNDKNGKEN